MFLASCGGSSTPDLNEGADIKTPPDDGSCLDMYSSNSTWSDNCVLKIDGLHAASTSYTLGVQRMLWCMGHALSAADEPVSEVEFVTGSFDVLTEAAMTRYQEEHELDVHGAVGTESWLSLQNQLVLVGANAAEYSSYSLPDGSCEGDILFYQRNTTPQDWKMALIRGSSELTDFSIDPAMSQ